MPEVPPVKLSQHEDEVKDVLSSSHELQEGYIKTLCTQVGIFVYRSAVMIVG